MPGYSGATRQAMARLLEENATHSVIDGLYTRYEVMPLPQSTSPNKLRKSTHLVQQLADRGSGEDFAALGRVDQEGSLSAGRVLNGDAAGDLGRGVGRAGAVDADGDREVEAVDGSSPRGRGYGVEVPHRGAVAGRAGAVR